VTPPQNLLVGYGTLLSQESTAKTVGPTASAKPFEPVIVPGFRRLFNLRPAHYRPSFHLSEEPIEVAAMNVMPWEDSSFNGLAFPVSRNDLEALDERERYYQRIRVPVLAFPNRESLGEAWVYSAPLGAPAVFEPDSGLRPQWEDLVMARAGAYAKGEDFGTMFDETTFLADGRTLAADAYRVHLPEPFQP
jgi:cation transport regulator ChaC